MDHATARQIRARENQEHVRILLAARNGPGIATVISAAGQLVALLRYERCPHCGGWRERAVTIHQSIHQYNQKET